MKTTLAIYRLLSYGLDEKLIGKDDIVYSQNRLFSLFEMEGPESGFEAFIKTEESPDSLEEIIGSLCSSAFERKIIKENSVTFRDLFDAKLMDVLVPRPSEVRKKFWNLYKSSPEEATDFYYGLSRKSNYIKTYRIKKDLKWKTETEFGFLDITVNLSKPEKDPKAIALAKTQKAQGYPKCLLCAENEGYSGNLNHPARNNHRLIPLTLEGEEWFLQYSPYVYYNEHCIVLSGKHSPMAINESTFRKLFAFVSLFPHYTIGSNADLPIVGGSILSHEHFQGGFYDFPLNRAKVLERFEISGFPDVECGIVSWPMSVVRLSSENPESVIKLACRIFDCWKTYSDEASFIFSETEGIPHNTVTPILKKDGDVFVFDLVLRNNITTPEHPLGVFHPHASLHHIKKENIGLIEVMGLAILPSRLKDEMEILKDALLCGKNLDEIPEISSHAEWAKGFSGKYDFTEENIGKIIQDEIGKVFLQVLKDSGVFKQTEKGLSAFRRFLNSF